MKSKKVMQITLLLLAVLTIGAVNAAEITADDTVSVENQDGAVNEGADDLNSNENDDILTNNPKTFTDLNESINNNQNTDIYLNESYLYNSDTDSVYTLGITINRAVTIHGNGFTIDANNSCRIFKVVVKDSVVFKDIVFANGISRVRDGGGAIYNNYANLSLINCSFVNNVGYRGGAIMNDYVMTVIDCSFINNSAYSNADGAIYSENAFSVKNSQFINNSALGSAGAIYSRAGLSVEDCNFVNNTAIGGNGGAIAVFKESLKNSSAVINSNFTYNSAAKGNGGAVAWITQMLMVIT